MFCNVILIILFLIESVIDVLYTDKCIDFITFPFLKQVAICVIFFLKCWVFYMVLLLSFILLPSLYVYQFNFYIKKYCKSSLHLSI